MPYTLDFEVPELPDLQAAAAKGHWRTRYAYKNRWQERVRAVVLGDHYLPDAPLKRATLRCTRYSSRECDRDNLVSSFKSIIDGLVKIGVIEDDKPSVVGSPEFAWEKAPRGQGKIRVQVREVCE